MPGKNKRAKKRPSKKQLETRTRKLLEAMDANRLRKHLGR